MLEAFQQGAGFSAAALSLFVRALVSALIFLWAAWVIQAEWKLWASESSDEGGLFGATGSTLVFLALILMYFSL